MKRKKRQRIDRDLHISDRDKRKGYTYEDSYNSKIAIDKPRQKLT